MQNKNKTKMYSCAQRKKILKEHELKGNIRGLHGLLEWLLVKIFNHTRWR